MVVAFWAMPLIFTSDVSIKHSLLLHLFHFIENLDLSEIAATKRKA